MTQHYFTVDVEEHFQVSAFEKQVSRDEMARATVAQIVAIHRGDDHVAQAHRLDGTREVRRFGGIERVRATVADIAERATPRADVAHDHECRCTFGETLAKIRAGRLFADRIQAVFTQARFQFLDAISGGRLGANPGRLALH